MARRLTEEILSSRGQRVVVYKGADHNISDPYFVPMLEEFRVFFAGRRADIDHIIHDNQPGHVGERCYCEGAALIRWQGGEVETNLQVVRGSRLLIVENRRKNRKSVYAAASIGHKVL